MRQTRLICIFLFCITLLAYLPVRQFEFVDLDDAAVDVRRRAVRLPGDRRMALHHHAVLDRFQLRRRDVAHHETGRRLGVEGAQADDSPSDSAIDLGADIVVE